MLEKLSGSSYHHRNPEHLKNFLYDALLSIVFIGLSVILILNSTETGLDALHPARTTLVVGVCIFIGLVAVPLFYLNKRLRQIWENKILWFITIFIFIISSQTLIMSNLISNMEFLTGVTSLVLAGLLARAVLYFHMNSTEQDER